MPRLMCKNTFISLGNDEKQPTRSLFRSKSEEPSPHTPHEQRVDETAALQIMRLNSFFINPSVEIPTPVDDDLSTPVSTESVRDDTEVVRELQGLQQQLRDALAASLKQGTRVPILPGSQQQCQQRCPVATQAPSDASARQHAPTTVMIQNLPKSYTQNDLIAELDCLGFAGAFDFIHIPPMEDVGRALVNFVNPMVAAKCMHVFSGYHFQCKQGSKVASASVAAAQIQGLGQNMQYYENSALNTSKKIECRPLVMANLSKLIA